MPEEKHNSTLDQLNSRSKVFMENLSDGVVMFDQHQKVIYANPAATSYTGLPSEGYSLIELFSLFATITYSSVERAFDDRSTVHIKEAPVSRFIYELHIIPMFKDEELLGGAITIHDITHVKEIDRMKTEFVSVASHQLRTPLTAIKWHLELLSDSSAGLNKEQKESMAEVNRSNERMIRLVNDLLNVSRLETGRLMIEPKSLDLQQFIEDVVFETTPLAKKRNITIALQLPEDKLAPVMYDDSLLWQVIHNLLTNAIKYSAGDGEGKVEVKLIADDKYFILTVRDNGIGIPEAEQKRIFERFFRAGNATTQTTSGTGLGLYVVKLIVEAMAGKISFESKENEGTIFQLDLPRDGVKAKKGERKLEM